MVKKLDKQEKAMDQEASLVNFLQQQHASLPDPIPGIISSVLLVRTSAGH